MCFIKEFVLEFIFYVSEIKMIDSSSTSGIIFVLFSSSNSTFSTLHVIRLGAIR